MKVPKEIFRMYDIRGIADRDITEDFAFNLGRAFGKIVRENGGKAVAVGMDVRPTSPKYKDALVDGFRQTGIDVYDIGVVPTPLQYYSLYKLPVDGGIQVTASHNPREYNGFKISLGKYSFFGEGIQRLREIIEKEEFLHLFERGKHFEEDMVDPYVDEMVKNVKVQGKIKVALDAGNGTAGPVITQILDELKVPYDGIYLEPDGNFPNHLPDPTVVEYMKDLMEKVKKEGFDLGVGYDGDSDRIGAIDETGNIIFGDKLLAIFAKQVLKFHPGAPIIFDVKCSKGVVEYIEKLGGRP
ncbi:MAG: phosphomannomutase, partial [Candidatus Hydrothermota bacterium]